MNPPSSTGVSRSTAVTVTIGTGSQLNPDFLLTVGNSNQGSLTVSHSASVTTDIAYLGEQSGSNGTLEIDSGGTVNLTEANIAAAGNANGSVTVTGTGSLLRYFCSSNINFQDSRGSGCSKPP